MNPRSPLTNNDTVKIASIETKEIVKNYFDKFQLDVSEYFKDYGKISIYECVQTGYKFYYPFDIYGDSKFYEYFQQYDWYYMPWKWEHETTYKLLGKRQQILEVGSGGLGFMEKIKNFGFNITGLELNNTSVITGQKKGLNVLNESIQDHSIKNFEKYDLVCSFQVLEHITEVHSFIKAQVDCLKIGGKLIISVPNNSSFIRFTNGGVLNSPPHHMGLWDAKSLTNLASLFNLNVYKIIYEPLQEYHTDWYVSTKLEILMKKNKFSNFLFGSWNIKKLYSWFVRKFRLNIHGHSILIIYEKS